MTRKSQTGRCINRYFLTFALALLSACSVDSAKSRFILAERLWKDGKYAAAVQEFERVVSKDPRGKLGRQARFRAAMTESIYLGEYSDAIAKFKAFSEGADPSVEGQQESWQAKLQIGEIYFSRLERYDEAILHYSAMIRARPDAPERGKILYRIGRSHFYLWQFDRAISAFEKVLKEDPLSEWAEKAMLEIGTSWFTSGEQNPGDEEQAEPYQKAIKAYDAFLKRFPNSRFAVEARFGIASSLEELDQLDAAYEKYEALKETYPSPNVIEIKLTRIRERKEQRDR